MSILDMPFLIRKHTEIEINWPEPPSDMKKQMRVELTKLIQTPLLVSYEFDRAACLPDGSLSIMLCGQYTKQEADALMKDRLPTVHAWIGQ